MSVTYQTTFKIFKKHPLGYVAIVLWVLASIIDVLDMLLSLAAGDLLSALLDLLVVVALIGYTLFVSFASVTIFFDIMYAVVALGKGYYLTGYYWFTLIMDISLTFFTIIGVSTTLKNVKSFDEFTVAAPQYSPTSGKYTPYAYSSPVATNPTTEPSVQPVQPVPPVGHQPAPVPPQTAVEVKFCTNCGAKNKFEAKFCTSCGAAMR
ncbi:MAG: zinc ribbon domain-containing protein [Candidatus Heimdallarchaeaceae archaeon]